MAAYRNVIRYKQDDGNTHLGLARNLMRMGNYNEALKEYQIADDSLKGNALIKDGKWAAEHAAAWKKEGSRYLVKKMEVFNSRRADYSPMLFGDQYDQLYFTSTRNEANGDELSGITGTKNGDIFYSEKDDKGKWSRPKAVESGTQYQR